MSSAGLPGCHRKRGAGLCFSPFLWFCKDGGHNTQLPSLQPRSCISFHAPTVHLCQACAFNSPVAPKSMQCASSSLFSSLPWPEPMAGPAAPVSLSAPPAPLSLCRSSGSQVRASSSNQSGASGAVSSRNQPQGERRQSASRRVARLSCWASGGSLAQANSWNQPQGPRADLLPRKLPESSAGTQLESTVQRIKRINLKSSKRKAESY